jgi:hypothetical protein
MSNQTEPTVNKTRPGLDDLPEIMEVIDNNLERVIETLGLEKPSKKYIKDYSVKAEAKKEKN